MSKIYLKVTVEKFSKLRFSGCKNLWPGQFWGAPTHPDITEFENLLQLKYQTSGSKMYVAFLLFQF